MPGIILGTRNSSSKISRKNSYSGKIDTLGGNREYRRLREKKRI